MLGGVNSPIDLENLGQHTHHSGLYNKYPTIQAFWKVWPSYSHVIVVHTDFFAGAGWLQPGAECDLSQAAADLSSCKYLLVRRPKLTSNKGFKQLNLNFAIREARSDQDRLPTVSTCVNLLKVNLSGSPIPGRRSCDQLLRCTNEHVGSKASPGHIIWRTL